MVVLCALLILLSTPIVTSAALNENERLAEYHSRNYTWPPPDDEYLPATPGWRKIFQRRFSQVDAISTEDNCYNGYMSSIHSGIKCPNFTEYGYGLTLAPESLTNKLKELLHAGVHQDNMRMESSTQCIRGDPKFVDIDRRLLDNSLLMLKPILEAWSGVELIPNNAYGLRVYMNESALNMHIDKVETHVISAIMHVDHDEDSEPWPLVIEDFQGNTVEVSLESGDILLYESSKCFHGRPRPFNGKWYSSLFLHFYPVDWDESMRMETHYRVPPTWAISTPSEYPLLNVVDTSLYEPECDHGWCDLKNSVVYAGPAPGYGRVMAGGKVEELIGLISESELTEAFNFKDLPDDDEL